MSTEPVPTDGTQPNARISDNPDVCFIEAALSTYAGGPAGVDVGEAWARLKAIIHDPCFTPTPPPVPAVTREELEDLIDQHVEAQCTYADDLYLCGQEDAADAILSRLAAGQQTEAEK